MLPKPTPNKSKRTVEEAPKKDEIIALFELIEEKPWHAAGAVLFVAICFFAGLIYRSQAETRAERTSAELMSAIEKENPTEKVASLEEVAKKKSFVQAEALYRLGEAAFENKDYTKAQEAFERVRKEFSKSPFAPDAVEGLGFVYESLDPPDFDRARASYEQVMNDWPDSFAATRQFVNLGRCYEKQGNFNDAIAAYRSQLAMAPASSAAKSAQDALDRLRLQKPELFKDEKTENTSETPESIDKSVETPSAQPGETKEPETSQPAAQEVNQEEKADNEVPKDGALPQLELTLPSEEKASTSGSDVPDSTLALPQQAPVPEEKTSSAGDMK